MQVSGSLVLAIIPKLKQINMERNINNFIIIDKFKNGRLKISHNGQNQTNIYKLLHELGFRKSKLDNKQIYFRRDGEKLIPINFNKIVDAFFDLFNESAFTNIPEDIEFEDIVNHFYENQPIKENRLFNLVFNDTISELEAHNLRMLIDDDYKHRFETQQLLSKLEELNFIKTIDIGSLICKNAPLFYKKIEANKFLVFVQFNSKIKTLDGFDCSIATFDKIIHIGTKKPLEHQIICRNFKLDRDFNLVENYLNN